MSLIKCVDLTIGYDNNEILSDINFSLKEGEYLCILGPNGAGKSTLLKTLIGFIKPIKGKVERNYNKASSGYLAQYTDIQNDFPATSLEVVLSGMLNYKTFRFFFKKEDKERAKKYLEKFNLLDKMNFPFKDLSGGQKQKVLLARSLIREPKVLFLDEPTSGLDDASQKEFYETIKKINKEGTTIVMISHDIKAALDGASHILYIGEKIVLETKDEFIKDNIMNLKGD